MVNYKLGIFNKNNEGKIINLDSIITNKKLQELDNFTCLFDSESQLKVYLFNLELISNSELLQKINIMYRNNGKIKKLPVLYKGVKEYRDVVTLKYKLRSKSSDIEFLSALADHYDNGSTKFNKQKQNVSDIRLYLSDVRSSGGNFVESSLLENALDNLLVRAAYKPANSNGEVIEDYRGLRDLAMFIWKYETKQKSKQEKKEKWVQGTLFEQSERIQQINENVFEEEEKFYKSNLSSDGDPDFPYNSEEEEIYNRYIESLPDEYHPHRR